MFLLSDVLIYVEDIWALLGTVTLYLFISFIYTKSTGIIVYPFMTWEDGDYLSLLITSGVFVIGIVIEAMCSLMT